MYTLYLIKKICILFVFNVSFSRPEINRMILIIVKELRANNKFIYSPFLVIKPPNFIHNKLF